MFDFIPGWVFGTIGVVKLFKISSELLSFSADQSRGALLRPTFVGGRATYSESTWGVGSFDWVNGGSETVLILLSNIKS